MQISAISREELKTWLDEGRDFVLLDTVPAEDFAVAHLPNARNACVYEVTFLDQVRKLHGLEAGGVDGAGILYEEPVVTYGSSSHSLASTTAAEKLHAAGFAHVYNYFGGLEDWRAAGYAVKQNPGAARRLPGVEDRDYVVNPQESTVEWTGRSLGGKHQGTVGLTGGEISVKGGRAAGGWFTLDMTSLANTDLADPGVRSMLIKHLRSDDFFDVEKFPQARFVLGSIEPITGAMPGSLNHRVSGCLLLKGVEAGLEFDASIALAPDGEGALVARANFDLDRTRWNVLYGSGKFYERLGKHLVNDLITLDLKIVAR